MPMPSLAAIRAFDTAARLGSFKAAADNLNVSATAISHHIRGLEAQIGVALFVRGTRKVSLTDAGRQLAEATSASFSRIEAALEALRTSEHTLTVSTTPAFAALWLAPRLTSFEARHQDIRIRLVSSADVTDLRKDQTVDLAIRYDAEDREPQDAMLVAMERFCAFGSRDYVERLVDLPDTQFISTRWISKTLRPVTWQNWCEAAGEKPVASASVREFHQEYEVLQAGLSGQGLILLSDVLAQDMVARGWLVPYRPDVCLSGFAYRAVVNPHRREAKKVQRFLSWLQDEARPQSRAPQ
ncbi:LysR substrate-binding domain-containing protein [Gimibacter soli]|uniref:LysR substrate-binding domain-containing protein n=1 Tax=Gimibacter soli TaxID=3024400 RepID=A0AAE9XL55_9PROT|nr:LysR substrate-binding domain-containing protein [Gimibacter soli]WCL52913.1 LysR substrate-binding domain-containing protein [Gimibacter soli]